MPRKISEETTRKQMIDPQLEQAGWYLRDHSKVKTAIPVDGYNSEPWNGNGKVHTLHENLELKVMRFEPMRGRMGESEKRLEGLFEPLLNEAFAEG
jgi:hypothetical protein